MLNIVFHIYLSLLPIRVNHFAFFLGKNLSRIRSVSYRSSSFHNEIRNFRANVGGKAVFFCSLCRPYVGLHGFIASYLFCKRFVNYELC